MRPAIRAVWSESSLNAIGILKDAKLFQEDNEDTDQTAHLRSLIRVFVGRTCPMVRPRMLRFKTSGYLACTWIVTIHPQLYR